MVIFDIEIVDFLFFDRYLEDKIFDIYIFNFWFNEYYEFVYNCFLLGGGNELVCF